VCTSAPWASRHCCALKLCHACIILLHLFFSRVMIVPIVFLWGTRSFSWSSNSRLLDISYCSEPSELACVRAFPFRTSSLPYLSLSPPTSHLSPSSQVGLSSHTRVNCVAPNRVPNIPVTFRYVNKPNYEWSNRLRHERRLRRQRIRSNHTLR
jgi:hypothetical protein